MAKAKLTEFPTETRARTRSNVVPRQQQAADAFDGFIANTKAQLALWIAYQGTQPPAEELAAVGAVFTANAASLMSPSRIVALAHVLDIIAAGTPNPNNPGNMYTRQELLDTLAAVPQFNPATDLHPDG